jgi:hypothetical protein
MRGIQGRVERLSIQPVLPDFATAVQSGTGGEANKRDTHLGNSLCWGTDGTHVIPHKGEEYKGLHRIE